MRNFIKEKSFEDESQYYCKCFECEDWFLGHKRRQLCKICEKEHIIEVKKRDEKENKIVMDDIDIWTGVEDLLKKHKTPFEEFSENKTNLELYTLEVIFNLGFNEGMKEWIKLQKLLKTPEDKTITSR